MFGKLILRRPWSAVLITLAALPMLSACNERDNRAAPVGQTANETVLVMKNAEVIAGTGLLRANVGPRPERGASSMSYDSDFQRNIIIIDPRTGSNRRLLTTNERTVVDDLWLPDAERLETVERRDGDPVDPIAFYVLSLRQLDHRDKIDIIVGRVDGGPATPIITGADELLAAQSLGHGQLALLVVKDGRAGHHLVTMDGPRLLSTTAIAVQ